MIEAINLIDLRNLENHLNKLYLKDMKLNINAIPHTGIPH